jgi:hypothetical protein
MKSIYAITAAPPKPIVAQKVHRASQHLQRDLIRSWHRGPILDMNRQRSRCGGGGGQEGKPSGHGFQSFGGIV